MGDRDHACQLVAVDRLGARHVQDAAQLEGDKLEQCRGEIRDEDGRAAFVFEEHGIALPERGLEHGLLLAPGSLAADEQ